MLGTAREFCYLNSINLPWLSCAHQPWGRSNWRVAGASTKRCHSLVFQSKRTSATLVAYFCKNLCQEESNTPWRQCGVLTPYSFFPKGNSWLCWQRRQDPPPPSSPSTGLHLLNYFRRLQASLSGQEIRLEQGWCLHEAGTPLHTNCLPSLCHCCRIKTKQHAELQRREVNWKELGCPCKVGGNDGTQILRCTTESKCWTLTFSTGSGILDTHWDRCDISLGGPQDMEPEPMIGRVN